MKVNRYLIETTNSYIGQMVCKDNKSDDVIGFVYKKYNNLTDVVLFEENEAPDNVFLKLELKEQPIKLLFDTLEVCEERVKNNWIKQSYNK